MSYWDEITARLAALTGVATPVEARQQLREFDVRDIEAVRVSEGGGTNGGSQPVASALITMTDLLTAGVLLATPAADERVIVLAIEIVTPGDMSGCDVAVGDGALVDGIANQAVTVTSGQPAIPQPLVPITYSLPVYLYLSDSGFVLLNARAAWQALHNYTRHDAVIDSNGDLQFVLSPGQSGATEPVWSGGGGTTTDGGVTWTDAGTAPTVGEFRVWTQIVSAP